jgi:hypothetical protein
MRKTAIDLADLPGSPLAIHSPLSKYKVRQDRRQRGGTEPRNWTPRLFRRRLLFKGFERPAATTDFLKFEVRVRDPNYAEVP